MMVKRQNTTGNPPLIPSTLSITVSGQKRSTELRTFFSTYFWGFEAEIYLPYVQRYFHGALLLSAWSALSGRERFVDGDN
jgi:hypothetical protein